MYTLPLNLSRVCTALMLVLAVPACDKEGDEKPASADESDAADKTKDEPAKDEPAKDDGDAADEPKAAADDDEPTKVAAAADDDDEEEIDIDALLAAKESASGVLSQNDLDGIDDSPAPALGKHVAEQAEDLKEAQWLTLPGSQLEIPQPPEWKKFKKDNVGVLVSPDEKVAIVFTPVTDQAEVAKALEDIGKLAKITTATWKDPKQVKLGPDGLPALVRAADVEIEGGKKGGVIFAVVDTGTKEKILAIGLGEKDATPEAQQQGQHVLLSIRRKA